MGARRNVDPRQDLLTRPHCLPTVFSTHVRLIRIRDRLVLEFSPAWYGTADADTLFPPHISSLLGPPHRETDLKPIDSVACVFSQNLDQQMV